ncbi:MAG: CoA pyrophosphatase [Candidatus Promineifilaceae bacterium]|nr:CoA pyrophosphatase [Candidatus Promineifilaceae bacterium]
MTEFDGPAAQSQMQPVPRENRRPPSRPGDPRLGAVLMLLYEKEQQMHLVLTRRRDDLQAHAGQISLPGGRQEPQETLRETALRETREEVGVPPAAITILGQLTSLYIFPSDFEVHPFVGWHDGVPAFRPQPAEVAEIIETPLAAFFDEQTRREEMWEWRDNPLQVPFFQIGEHKVWGATAMILSDFVERVRAVQADNPVAGR